MKRENIFEDDKIIIYHDLKGYDFQFEIMNKTNKRLVYYLNGLDEYITLEAKDWLGFLGGDLDREIIDCFMVGDAEIYDFSKEFHNFYKEIEEKINNGEQLNNDYLRYRLYWLNNVAEKVF